jgi:hypothetical protein
VGPANPREFTEVTSTTEVLAPLANATGGDVVRVENGSGVHLPRIVAVRSSDVYHGDDWLGHVAVAPLIVNNNPETRELRRRRFRTAAGWCFARTKPSSSRPSAARAGIHNHWQ